MFKDETKLSIRYIPTELIFRTDELKFLARYFKGIFDGHDDGKNLIIHGPVGSGKTSIAKKFGLWAQSRENSRKIAYVHINCRINRSTFTILLAIARELNKHIPSRGYSSHELLEMIIDILESKQEALILVLDEVDFVLGEEISDLIYSLCRSSDSRSSVNHYISLVMIARDLKFLTRLDNSTLSTLGAGNMNLSQYAEAQLLQIFSNRIHEVFKQGAVTEDALLLTSRMAGKTGDARKGLELLWYAGKYADQQSSPLVFPDYIRIAKGNIQPGMIRESLVGLGLQKLLIYHAVARGLQVNKSAFITAEELLGFYTLSGEAFEIPTLDSSDVMKFVAELRQLGLIETSPREASLDKDGTLITIEDISAQQLEMAVHQLLTE
ncbi:MAG: Cdc6/Cdc18 family protein [Candidatus Kariarchaeaceae archaeon]